MHCPLNPFVFSFCFLWLRGRSRGVKKERERDKKERKKEGKKESEVEENERLIEAERGEALLTLLSHDRMLSHKPMGRASGLVSTC